jgi:DNA-binding response OmpR family regulator
MSNGAKKTILLVEDDEAYRAALEAALRRNGYRVLPAESYDAALAVRERQPEIQLRCGTPTRKPRSSPTAG